MLPMTIGLLQGSLKGNKKYRAKENSYPVATLCSAFCFDGDDGEAGAGLGLLHGEASSGD